MVRTKLLSGLFALSAALVQGAAFAASIPQAGTVSLSPSSQVVSASPFTLDLAFDGSGSVLTPLFTGEVTVSYDPSILQYVGFMSDPGCKTLTAADCAGPVTTGSSGGLSTLTLGFGDVDFLTGTIGTFTFNALAATSNTDVGLAEGFPLGSFFYGYSSTVGGTNFEPTFVGASLTVTPTGVVPLPGALWLMASGLVTLGFARRKTG